MNFSFVQDRLRGGGTERQSIELAKHLQIEGAEVHLIVGAKGAPLDGLGLEQMGERLHFISQSENCLSHMRAFFYLRRRTYSEVTTVICMGRWAHLLFGLLPKRPNLRIISTVRGNRGLPYLYRRCIRKSVLLIANSRWAADYATQKMGAAQLPRIAVVRNALSRPELLEIGPAERTEARQHFQIAEDKFVAINAARLVPGKGQSDLIRAIAEVKDPNIQLWLLGEGPEKGALKRLAKDLRVADQVVFCGFQEEVRPYYAMADLFVSASTLDSLPNALIEAHAAGLPIVAYPSAGIPEIVDHEATGILCQENTPSEITRWIAHASEQIEWCQRLGSNGREKIRTEFSRERLHRDFKELVMNIAPSPNGT